jgi:hypothetical protein
MEISFMWNARWGPMKILYLISRYMPFIDVTLAIVGEALVVYIILHRAFTDLVLVTSGLPSNLCGGFLHVLPGAVFSFQ